MTDDLESNSFSDYVKSNPAPAAAAEEPESNSFRDYIQGKPDKPKPEVAGNAITDVPHEISAAASEGLQNIKGLAPWGRGEQSALEGIKQTGKGVMGVAQLAASPITGAARSLLGHPLASAIHATGEMINPELAAKDDPKEMYESAKRAVDTALSAVEPRLRAPGPATALAGASERLGVPVPRVAAPDEVSPLRGWRPVFKVCRLWASLL